MPACCCVPWLAHLHKAICTTACKTSMLIPAVACKHKHHYIVPDSPAESPCLPICLVQQPTKVTLLPYACSHRVHTMPPAAWPLPLLVCTALHPSNTILAGSHPDLAALHGPPAPAQTALQLNRFHVVAGCRHSLQPAVATPWQSPCPGCCATATSHCRPAQCWASPLWI